MPRYFFFFRCLSESQWHKKRPWVSWLNSLSWMLPGQLSFKPYYQPWVWAGFLAPWALPAQPSTLQRCLHWLQTHKLSPQKPESPAAIAQLVCHTKDQQHFLRQQVLLRRMPTVLIPSCWCLICCNFSEMGPYSPLYQELCSTIQISPWS